MATTPFYTIDNGILKSTDPDRELKKSYVLAASTYFGMGMLLCDAGGGKTLAPTGSNASTGTPLAIMPMNGTTDSAGNFTPGTPTTATQFGVTYPTLAVLTGGTFKTTDIAQAGPGSIHANHFVPGGAQNTGWTLQGTITAGWIEK